MLSLSLIRERRLHLIYKEDHRFFPLVKKEFSEAELQGLTELSNKEEEKSGGEAFEKARKLVQEMAALL